MARQPSKPSKPSRPTQKRGTAVSPTGAREFLERARQLRRFSPEAVAAVAGAGEELAKLQEWTVACRRAVRVATPRVEVTPRPKASWK